MLINGVKKTGIEWGFNLIKKHILTLPAGDKES